MSDRPTPGSISWRDISVADAAPLRDFYSAVAGWEAQATTVGDYEDYAMLDADGNCVAGICHARGSNATLPAQWLVYINVPDLDASIAACLQHGGEVIDGPRGVMGGRFAAIRDPAGAVSALYQAPPSDP